MLFVKEATWLMCWPDRLGRSLLQCWLNALTTASLEICVKKWRGWRGSPLGRPAVRTFRTLQSQLAFALESKHMMRVQRRGSASQRANQNPRGWRSAGFLKSIEKCVNSWILCSSSPLPSLPRFWEHESSLSLMKSGRLSQLQCWDMSGHEAHYPNFLRNGLTPSHSVRVSQLKAASQTHISLQSSSRGKNISLSNLTVHVLTWYRQTAPRTKILCTVVMSPQFPSEQKEIHLAVNKPDADKFSQATAVSSVSGQLCFSSKK